MAKLNEHIDLRRLIRAAKLRVFKVNYEGDPLPEWHYMVRGSEGDPYFVQTAPHIACDCPDYEIRGKVCKHIIRALWYEGDPHVLKAAKDTGMLHIFDGNVHG